MKQSHPETDPNATASRAALTAERARRFYASQAEHYDAGSRRGVWALMRRLETPAVLSLAEVRAGQRVLDAGCGAGHYTQALLERGAEVTALDVAPAMLEQVRSRLGVPTIEGDLGSVRLEPVFDTIVCAGVLEFVPDRGAALANLARGLRVDGERRVVVLILARCVPGLGFWALRRWHGIDMPMLTRRGVHEMAAQAGLGVERVVRAGYNWVCALRAG